jgi:glucose/arabinose dehydrogenase
MHRHRQLAVVTALVSLAVWSPPSAAAQSTPPSLVDGGLVVSPVVDGLVTPTSIAFLGPEDFLVLEKNTGQVKRVAGGAVVATVLDLAVNNSSERGLLGIALHPDFPSNPGVYLFWTCRAPASANAFAPARQNCSDDSDDMLGADTEDILAVPMLGNRVDRFRWTGTRLVFDRNLIRLLAFQNDAAADPPGQDDAAQPARGNHDGGVIAFGRDRKLYVLFGDAGRRGQMQNLPFGPTVTSGGPAVADDQFGGPQPDHAHFTGVILRLNDDGTAPADNPFFAVGAAMGGEAGGNVQKVFAYGIRNSFGMAFDPVTGALWDQENGEDAFDEINRVEAGMNSGWIQVIGPLDRVDQYRQIETTSLHHEDFPNLQQVRWGPERISVTPQEAAARLFVLPGSQYSDPEFSWKHVLAPAAIGFLSSGALGERYEGDLFVGMAVPDTLGGPLFRFNLSGDRRGLVFDDPRLDDLVADNATFHDMGESDSLLFGRDFGVVTDIETSPGGALYVVSIDKGAVYQIQRR